MRPAAVVDPAVVGTAVAMRLAGRTWPEIAVSISIPKGTISSRASAYGRAILDGIAEHSTRAVANDIQSDASLRATLLKLIETKGRVADSRDVPGMLQRAGGRWDNLHNVQHVLASLHKQGLVTYVERQRGNARWYQGVQLARINGVRIEDSQTIEDALGFPPEAEVALDTPEPEAEPSVDASASWPVLDELRGRAAERAAIVTRATAYLEAAALLDAIDPDEARGLSDKAGQLAESVQMSRVEAEYLAFADATSDRKEE
jgi:hypothetical protein